MLAPVLARPLKRTPSPLGRGPLGLPEACQPARHRVLRVKPDVCDCSIHLTPDRPDSPRYRSLDASLAMCRLLQGDVSSHHVHNTARGHRLGYRYHSSAIRARRLVTLAECCDPARLLLSFLTEAAGVSSSSVVTMTCPLVEKDSEKAGSFDRFFSEVSEPTELHFGNFSRPRF